MEIYFPGLGVATSKTQGVRLHHAEWAALEELGSSLGVPRNQLIRRILVTAIAEAKAQQAAGITPAACQSKQYTDILTPD